MTSATTLAAAMFAGTSFGCAEPEPLPATGELTTQQQVGAGLSSCLR